MIIITILAVSLDAYVAGISMGGKYSTMSLLYASAYSFFLPVIAIFFSVLLNEQQTVLNILSACILIVLGAKGLLPVKKNKGLCQGLKKEKEGFFFLTLLGVSLSIDSAFATLASYDVEYFLFFPFVLMYTHFVLLTLGQYTAKLLGFSEWLMKIASAILMFVGILRL